MANFVIFRDHYAMPISQYIIHKERSFSVFFYNIFRGNSNENLHLSRINIIFIH